MGVVFAIEAHVDVGREDKCGILFGRGGGVALYLSGGRWGSEAEKDGGEEQPAIVVIFSSVGCMEIPIMQQIVRFGTAESHVVECRVFARSPHSVSGLAAG